MYIRVLIKLDWIARTLERMHSQVGFSLELLEEKMITRTIPTAVNLPTPGISMSGVRLFEMGVLNTYTRPAANITATPSFFRKDKFSFKTS